MPDKTMLLIGRLKKYKQDICPRCGREKHITHTKVNLPLGETTTAEPLQVIPISCKLCGEVWFVTASAPTLKDRA